MTQARRLNILYLGQPSDRLKARVAGLGAHIEMVEATSRDEALRAASSAEVVAGSGRLFNRELVAAAPELRWVQAMSAGVEHFCPCLAGSEIVLTNARGAHPIPIAEHFLALLLALTRRLPEFLTLKARHEWRRLSLTEVRGMTLLILGLGNLGREITAAARGVGLRVVGYDPFIAIPAAAVDHLYPAGQLHAALGSADLVASAVPLTPATRGMLGAPEFAAMRKGAYFFNLSRGGVVDQAALVEGLTSGRLAGAGLDVFAEEPLPADSPLWDLPNVVITPHVAAESQFTRPRVEDVFVQNIERYLKGQPLLNRVDIARGF